MLCPSVGPTRPPSRLAVIGDVGGHVGALFDALCGLGLDPSTNRLPEGLTVVQVGDLVHRGPDSDAVVDFVDRLLEVNGPRWVQLAGNHEAQYLFEQRFRWPQTIAAASGATLRRWWADGTMTLASSFAVIGEVVRRPGGARTVVGAGGLLVTHAGLTLGCWDALGNPSTAQGAAAAINARRFDPDSAVWRAGQMLERRVVTDAGPVWAEASAELYLPWLRASRLEPSAGGCVSPGFHQAHGHASAFRWDSGRWSRTDLAATFAPVARVDTVRRHLRLVAGDQVLWGVDPVHGLTPAPRWEPLALHLAQPA